MKKNLGKNERILLICIIASFLIILAMKVPFLFRKKYYTDVFYAMDTFFEINVPKETKNKEDVVESVKKLVFSIDSKLNRYNPDSEISKINKYGFKQNVKVSPETIEVLKRAIYYGDISEGFFDITFEPLQNLYGFDTQNFKVPHKNEIEKAKNFVNYKYIFIDDNSLSVRLLKENVIINLSGLIKGYTLDKVSEFLLEKKIINHYLNFGGNILVNGVERKKIGIMNPRKDNILFHVYLENSSISTSADYQQFFEKNGKRFTHIVNPKDGNVSFPRQAVVAIAKKGIDADFLSTTIFISGFEEGKKIVEKYFTNAGFAVIEDERKILKFNF